MSQSAPTNSSTVALGKIKVAYRALYAVGILCFFIGGIAAAFTSQGGAIAGVIAVLMILFGALYIFLGVMIKRRSTVALIVAIVVMILNVITGVFNMIQTGSPASLFFPIGVLIALCPAYGAMKEIKERA